MIVFIRVVGPLQISQRATVPIVAAVIGGRLKYLTYIVWYKQRHTTFSAMDISGLDCLTQILGCCHIVNGIVDKDYIKYASEAQCTHITFDVLAVGIQATAHCQHLGREVRQRYLSK